MSNEFPQNPTENQVYPEQPENGELQWIFIDGSWENYIPDDNPDAFVQKIGDTMDGDLIQTPGEGVEPAKEGQLTTSIEDEAALLFRYMDASGDIKCAGLDFGYCARVSSDITVGVDGAVVVNVEVGQDAEVVSYAILIGDAEPDNTPPSLQWQREGNVGSGIFEDLTGETGTTYTPVAGDLAKKLQCIQTFFLGEDKEVISVSNHILVAPAPVVPIYIAWTLNSGTLSPAIANTQPAKLYKADGSGNFVEVYEYPTKIIQQHSHDITDPGMYVLESNNVTSLQFSNSDPDVDFVLDTRSDISNVNSLQYFLKGLTVYNQDLSWLDTSTITTLSDAFAENSGYAHDISAWDVSNVVNMQRTFKKNTAYNHPLKWADTSSLRNIYEMFRDNSTYTETLEYFDVSKVTDMPRVFYNSSYSHPGLNSWDVSRVTTMSLMFKFAGFNQDLDQWDTSSLLDMNEMFSEAKQFNGDITTWDVSKVVTADNTFEGMNSFNQDIGRFRWNACMRMNSMFNGAKRFNQDLTGWCVPLVVSLPDSFDNGTPAGFTVLKHPKWGSCPPVTVSKPSIGVSSLTGTGTLLAEPTDLLDIKANGVVDPAITPLNQWEVEDNFDSDDFVAIDGATGVDLQLDNTYAGLTVRLRQTFADDAGQTVMYSNEVAVNTAPTIKLPEVPFIVSFTTGELNVFIDTVDGSNPDLFQLEIDSSTGEQEWVRVEGINLKGSFDATTPGVYQFDVEAVNRLKFKGDADLLIDINSVMPPKMTTMEGMFSDLVNFVQPDLGFLDTSNITSLRSCFNNCSKFNGSISSWNTSNVTTMESMFSGAVVFNQDINAWDTSRVEKTYMMFYKNNAFNQDLNEWNVSNLTNMARMFYFCRTFNGDMSGWDVSKLTSLWGVWNGDWVFEGTGLDTWDVSNVTNMTLAFSATTDFVGTTIEGWNVSKVKTLGETFAKAHGLNADLSSWNVSNVTNLAKTFEECEVFNTSLDGWDTSNVKNTSGMFTNSPEFNRPLESFDMSGVSNMKLMFQRAKAFNQPLNTWDVSSATCMASMFDNAFEFDQDISGWCVSNINTAPTKFAFKTKPAFENDLAKQPQWGTCPPPAGARTGVATINNVSSSELKLAGTHTTGGQIRKLSDGSVLHSLGSGTFSVSVYDSVEIDTVGLLRLSFDESKATEFNISPSSDLEDITTGFEMFYNCQKFNQDLSWMDTSKWVDMHGMFTKAFDFNGDISTWDTSNVTNMSQMFFNMSGRNNSEVSRSIDVSEWDTSKVTDFFKMFDSSSKAWNPDVTNWDVSKAVDMTSMFYNVKSFNRNLSKWNTTNARKMGGMFGYSPEFGSSGALSTGLTPWDVSNVTNMEQMFMQSSSMGTNLSGWCVEKVTSPVNYSMFADGSPLASQPAKQPVWGTCPGSGGGGGSTTLGTVTIDGPSTTTTGTRTTFTLNWTGTAAYSDLDVQWAGDFKNPVYNNDGSITVDWDRPVAGIVIAQALCSMCTDSSEETPVIQVIVSA